MTNKLNLTNEQREKIAKEERNKYQREYYKNNKEKIQEINKRYWKNKLKEEELKENKGAI